MTSQFQHFIDPVSLPDLLGQPIYAIGNFDGVHLGHHALLDKARSVAIKAGQPVGVLTFAPHPKRYFQPDKPLFQLASETMKMRLLAEASVEVVVTLPFDAALARTQAEAFIRDILTRRLRASGVVIGHDFHFGFRRAGTPAMLTAAGHEGEFSTHIVQPVQIDGATVSSSRIRALLTDGDIAGANRLLGREWSVESEVRHGDKRGRELGYPTANLHLDQDIMLRHGIYAVRASFDGKSFDAVASFGSRPTFDDGMAKLEVHFFDFSGDIYGKAITIHFVGYIRDELKFDSIDRLIAQMDVDSRKAKAMLKSSS